MASEELILRVQQARSYARYLPGGEKHGTVVEDHVLSAEDAAAAVREELDEALKLLDARA